MIIPTSTLLSCWSILSLLLLVLPVTSLPTLAVKRQDNELQDILGVFEGYLNGISTAILSNVSTLLPPPDGGKYTITQKSTDPILRATELATTRETFLYGPPVAGGPYFPNGTYGMERVELDEAFIKEDLGPELTLSLIDAQAALAGAQKYDGLKTLKDYTKLYDGEWNNTLPNGPDAGIETNYTQDLLFSMERLSFSPYQVRRLNPSEDTLAFQVDNSSTYKTCGNTLQELFQAGRLFYSDYRDQGSLVPTSMFAAAVDAYFYIDQVSGEFLPLAIRTNVGANLIYTPQDTHNDWLLAKMMYNVNDFWFSQWNHLAGTHEVVQIAYMAAIRTISQDHPVLGILNRLMYEVFAIQPLAKIILFTPGSAVGLVFPYTGPSAQNYTSDRYFNKGAGRFQANYFYTDLRNRGLIDSPFGPALKNFPFYEDAAPIYDAIHKFFTTFVNSYYRSDTVLRRDREIQAWVKEANGPAQVIDFPSAINTRATLVDVLTQFAHLASTAHHVANTNELLHVASTLPFHPPSLYNEIPTAKGVTNLTAWEPPFEKVLEQFSLAGLFARPLLVNTNRTLLHMFDDPQLLSELNPRTTQAAATFKSKMQALSAKISARGFDAKGLSQGMPFVWKALDPNVQPYSITT